MSSPANSEGNLRFDEAFRSLTDFWPMKWQCRLFERLVRSDLPSACDIPTGIGKTSILPLWLLALVRQAEIADVRLPRRLIYIVNRRTVVDQATTVVERMRQRLLEPEAPDWKAHASTLQAMATTLRGLCTADDLPLAVSTLRGEFADNEEWKADPARPAIVVGTIDMIGSRLLFSGYGDGRHGRAHHAGLIGQDALIIHDEAHLTPAFGQLLMGIVDEQERSGELRRARVMELSATQRRTRAGMFHLEPQDEADAQTGQLVMQRLDAKKRLCLHLSQNLVAGIVEGVKRHLETPGRLLIYVRLPEDAQRVAEAIRKHLGKGAEQRVALLTGTIRGYERDRLVADHPVYQAMLDREARVQHTVFLVSTSAGEVGIDIDADHLVCDVNALDSMIQRLGRVNRRGGQARNASVDVVWNKDDADPGPKASAMDRSIAASLSILKRWHGESAGGLLVSPRMLRVLIENLSEKDRAAAFSPQPTIPALTDILLDNWSLTSIDDMPGRPEVAAYLHGVGAGPPQTYLAWRKEVAVLKEAGLDEPLLTDWFRACPIRARERLRENTRRVREKLRALLATHRKSQPSVDFYITILDERGRATWSTLSAISRKPEKNMPDILPFCTVILPTEAAGLDDYGMLNGEFTGPIEDIDVAELATENRRRERWIQVGKEDGKSQWHRLLTDELGEPPSELRERERVLLKEPQEGGEDEGESIDLVLMEAPGESTLESPETARVQQTLAEHARATQSHMRAIADRLGLEPRMKDALVLAARWHDRGKDRPVWQHFAHNDYGAEPLAKSTKYLRGRTLGGYRHEFGSMVEAKAHEDVRNSPERDLVLHLIAAHHGRARPHFELRAFDHEGSLDPASGKRRAPTSAENESSAIETMQRFGRLQNRFGRWGLAWLESLLRCADIMASKEAVAARPAAAGHDTSEPPEVET